MAKSRTITKERLERILSSRLALKEPVFLIERVGDRLVGDIISATFKGKRDHERQNLIWDALDDELGPDAAKFVGMLLAYTPDEWQLGAADAKELAPVKRSR